MTQDKPRIAFDTTLDLKTLIHVVSLIAALIIGYVQFADKVNSTVTNVAKIGRQTTRIEHYLESKDPDYWQKAHQNGDSDSK